MSSGSNDKPKSADAPSAEPAKPAASKDAAASPRVIRDAEGVIVGARGAGPKILGVIDLKGLRGKPKPGAAGGAEKQPRGGGRKQEIIIDSGAGGDQPKGRASARKAREVRSSRRMPGRRAARRGKPSSAGTAEMGADKKRVRVDEAISIGELARQMGVKAPKVIRVVWGMGIRNATVNTGVDVETAELVAAEFGYRVEDVSFDESELLDGEDEIEIGELRAPVIAVMGHVDHGKTTLLDRLRRADVAASEAGGITQHVGAYRVRTNAGPMVFVDTPGHAAFAAMRERGANLTDIAMIVVAANDGVMPTTIEALRQVQAADVPILVAVNKCDLPDADLAKVERQLMEHHVLSETYGGDTPIVSISAKTGAGVDELLEQLAVLAEVLELRATPEGRATGLVLESRIDRGRGVITTMLIQNGTLTRGDMLVAGESSGRVSALIPTGDLEDDEQDADAESDADKPKKKAKAKSKPKKPKGKAQPATVQTSGPSTVVEISGLDEPPPVGIAFNVVEDDKAAKQLIAHRREQRRRRDGARSSAISFADRLAAERRAEIPTVALVVRADVQGSLEAVEHLINEIRSDKVQTKIISTGVGEITEGDIKLATTARQAGGNVVPAILGFGVKAGNKASTLADSDGIPIRCAKIIYELSDALEALMLDQLAPSFIEHPIGKADIRKLFPTSSGSVCGCRVIDGKITRNAGIRVLRDGAEINSTKLASLRIVDRDVKEVGTDQECGILLVDTTGLREGDILQAFELEAIPPSL
ncbi:Translation initiation factor IF-2 [Enhygromyxa salina]|uniref:Translation initiation factor IF-2 n=1 Tax=Enhygromyxa salina TaxID=215803 RepID=A0A2S9YH78_9BACT|nr:Translation initiation factor IF-2 [Enhygromyxa salina]